MVDVTSLEIHSFVSIAPPATFNPMTCIGCAVHGVTLRPTLLPVARP
jgi:hypothetical protein